MRAALAPSARVASSARIRRRLAALITGRDRVARATSDFVLTTLARSRVQQAPIAIAASLGVAIISVALVTREGGFAELRTPRTVVLWIPIVLGYWIVVGLRASFAMPTELRAAWAFRVHSRLPSASYWSGVRAAMLAFAIGPALLVNALVVLPLLGWRVAAIHALVVCVASRYYRAVCVAARRWRSVYPRVSARTREAQNAMAALPARHVGDCVRAGADGTAGAERSVGTRRAAGERIRRARPCWRSLGDTARANGRCRPSRNSTTPIPRRSRFLNLGP